MKRTALALGLVLIACSTRSPRTTTGAPPRTRLDADTKIRVALAVSNPLLTATRDFAWYASDGRTLLMRGSRGQVWRVDANAEGMIRAIVPAGTATPWQRLLILRPNDTAYVVVNGKRYRGELIVEDRKSVV